MRALVSGATGFVGPHLVLHCAGEGDDVVTPGDERGGFDVTDAAGVRRVVRDLAPDVVYHLAAWSHVGSSWAHAAACYRVNVRGTANVLAAARAAGVRRVLVVGSAEEYGRVTARAPVAEDERLHPLTPYGVSKIGAAFLAAEANATGGPETIRTRTFSHTGPGQPESFVVPAFARRIIDAQRSGVREIAVGALDPVRDITDVRDVVRAYRRLMVDGVAGEVYNVGCGQGTEIGEIARRLVARAGGEVALRVDPALLRPVEVPYLVADTTRLRTTTGWEPRYTLDDTLDAVLAEARAR